MAPLATGVHTRAVTSLGRKPAHAHLHTCMHVFSAQVAPETCAHTYTTHMQSQTHPYHHVHTDTPTLMYTHVHRHTNTFVHSTAAVTCLGPDIWSEVAAGQRPVPGVAWSFLHLFASSPQLQGVGGWPVPEGGAEATPGVAGRACTVTVDGAGVAAHPHLSACVRGAAPGPQSWLLGDWLTLPQAVSLQLDFDLD